MCDAHSLVMLGRRRDGLAVLLRWYDGCRIKLWFLRGITLFGNTAVDSTSKLGNALCVAARSKSQTCRVEDRPDRVPLLPGVCIPSRHRSTPRSIYLDSISASSNLSKLSWASVTLGFNARLCTDGRRESLAMAVWLYRTTLWYLVVRGVSSHTVYANHAGYGRVGEACHCCRLLCCSERDSPSGVTLVQSRQ